MKKLLIVTDNNLSSVGGEQESTKIIISGVSDGFDVSVLQPGPPLIGFSGVKFYGFSRKMRIKHILFNPVGFSVYMWSVFRCLRRGNFHIVHTQAQVAFFAVALLVKLRLVPSFKFVHTERGLYTKYNFFFRCLFRLFLRDLDVFVTTTKLNYYLWHPVTLRLPRKLKVETIENTAGPVFEGGEYFKKRKSPLTLGFAGRYCEWKNWPLAVGIIEDLFKQHPNVTFEVRMCVGCLDSASEIAAKAMFDNLSNLLGESFIGNINVSLREMEAFYRDVDIFCLTSFPGAESFGRTVVEAMSRECVVLTTPGGGPVEVVNDPSLVCSTVSEFTCKISYFFSNPDALAAKGSSNAQRAKSVYSSSNNIRKHKLLYMDV